MAVDHGAPDSTETILLKHVLRLLDVAAIADILFMHRVEIAPLDPARRESSLHKLTAYGLVGVDNQRIGIRDAVSHKQTRHFLTCAVFDSVARIYDNHPLVLK